MIAAKDPQEFTPSGRQQLINHPGPYELYNEDQAGLSSELLRNQFEKVSISDSKQKEWWTIRRSPQIESLTHRDKDENKSCFEGDYTCNNISENSWTWKNVDSPKINKRLSDIQGAKKRTSNEAEPANDSFKTHKSNLGSNLNCQNLGVMEEELYVKDNVVIWSKGITSTGNCAQFDSSRVTICSYTSQYAVKHALWCTFYRELPSFNNANVNFHAKVDEPQGTPMPSICIVDNYNLKVFSVDSEDFVTTLSFPVGAVWNTKFGVILERDKDVDKKTDICGPTVFSMVHPLDEVSPVAIAQGSIRLIEDYSISIVCTLDKPSICMMYDTHTCQHSIYSLRKVRNDEWVEMSTKLRSEPPSLHNLSSRLKNRISMWDTRSETPSPFVNRPASVTNLHTHSQQQSKSHSPMATISRCQSPSASPLVGSNPWLPKLSYLHNSLRTAHTNTSLAISTSQVEAEDYHYVNPLLCFEHMWTDSFATQDNTGPASKVFLVDDLVGRSYLCYLIPSRLQLSIVCVDISSMNNLSFGLLTSISARDAVPIPHLHMLAILEHSGSIVLYSGLTAVGKLHIGGVLAQHILSPCMVRSFSQFNSPFPRRSTLLPQYSTPIAGPNFEEHFLSPVLPNSGPNSQTNLPIILDSYKNKGEVNRTQINGLRDAIADRITLQYSDGSYYRITLPPIATSALIENCLNALRQILPRDSTVTLLTRWYAVRNAPGPFNLNIEQEWEMFTSLTYELLGYDTEQSSEMPWDSPMTPLYVAKRQRQTTSGSSTDWNYLIDSKMHKYNRKTTSTLLNLQASIRTSAATQRTRIKVNTNAVLFSSIRIIHYTLHLLYEDFKLNVIKTGELPLLAQFLSKLSSDLTLKNYVMYYWKDFPDLCPKFNPQSNVIGNENLKNIVTWLCMQEEPENIMQHVYLLLKNGDVTPYPYIPNVNERSKAVIQLCGTYINGSRRTDGVEVCISSFVNNVLVTRPFSTPKAKLLDPSENISERIVLLMTEMGITGRDLDSFPIGINMLLYGALWKCREKPPVDWGPEAYNLLQRPDLAAQAELVKKDKIQESTKKQLLVPNTPALPEFLPTMKQVEDLDQDDGMEDTDSALLKMRFPEDHRVAEARRLLQSSKPVTIALIQRPDVADHDFIEEQEKHLYAICARTMALPVGRGMFTLRTATPVVTEPLPLPKLNLSGKAPPRGITVELGHIDYPQNMQHWPLFHNGVANGLRISPDAHNIDSTWIIFNKPKNSAETNYEHAGFLMALGLNGHLTNLTILNTYNYLSISNEMTSIGILLGLAAAMRGTANTIITKVLSLHLEALLPPTSMELDVSQNLQVAALLGVGLAYQGTAHRHITEVLLWEIGRPPGPEMENSTDRESYSLAAGLALGLVTLQQGGRPSGLSDLNLPDTLHYYMVGGNRRILEGSQRDKYRVPSFQIREGSNVNLDVTAPGATLALGLMYLKSGNKTLADWMSPPTTQYLLDFVRPDFLMLRILSRSLIMWDEVRPDKNWIENQVPETIRPFCMVRPTTSSSDVDYEAMNQAYCNIIAGACFAIGLKYAGSANNEAFTALLHFCHMFISLSSKSIAELAGKPTIETCLNVLLLSASMVMAGTGNLQIMRIVRHLRRRVGLTSSAVVTYGSHLAIHMALGLLFLGGGRYTLSNSPASIAALICAFYPKFPTHSADNRYHLQAFRHLYVLAVEPRLLIPKDVGTGRICYASLKVVHLDGSYLCLKGPCLIPDLNLLSNVSVEDERYWSVEFDRGRNWEQLQKLLTSTGLIEVKQRAGCLSYIEDKFGYRTELARTLTHSKTTPWNPPPKAITSFSSNAVVRHFSDNFLNPNPECCGSDNERSFLKMLTRATYECVIKDKESILPTVIALIKIIQDLRHTPSTLQIWQFKLICTQVLENSLSTHLVSSEVMLSLKQEVIKILSKWEPTIKINLKNYVMGKDFEKFDNEKEFVSYVTFYDLPCQVSQSENVSCLDVLNCFAARSYSPETIMKFLSVLDLQI